MVRVRECRARERWKRTRPRASARLRGVAEAGASTPLARGGWSGQRDGRAGRTSAPWCALVRLPWRLAQKRLFSHRRKFGIYIFLGVTKAGNPLAQPIHIVKILQRLALYFGSCSQKRTQFFIQLSKYFLGFCIDRKSVV